MINVAANVLMEVHLTTTAQLDNPLYRLNATGLCSRDDRAI